MHPCNAKRKMIFLTSFLVNKMTKEQVCIYSTTGLRCVVPHEIRCAKLELEHSVKQASVRPLTVNHY